MTALLLTACVGMITGAFLIFHISPMDFTLGVFHRLTVGPRSIRDEINEATQRKKPNFIRREILEAQTILKTTGKEDRFPMLCAASLLFFAVGAGIAIREMTKPLFSIPPHQFLFNAGSIDKRSYMEMLQLDEAEYNLIKFPQRGVCLYKCGNERYLLEVHAPTYKEKLFGTAGGR